MAGVAGRAGQTFSRNNDQCAVWQPAGAAAAARAPTVSWQCSELRAQHLGRLTNISGGYVSVIDTVLQITSRRLAEVSLTDLRVPLAWRGSAGQPGGQARYAVVCLVSCGGQIYDSGLIMEDRGHTDNQTGGG